MACIDRQREINIEASKKSLNRKKKNEYKEKQKKIGYVNKKL